MGQLVNDTLFAWLLIESLSPGEVDYKTEDTLSEEHFKNGNKQTQLQAFNEYFDIWNEERFVISDEKRKEGNRIFKFYRNCFRYNEINLKIQDIFNSHSEIFNPNSTHCYGYTFNTDEKGYVMLDSIHIPMIMSALKEIEKDKNADIEEKFEDSAEKFKQKLNEILADEPINEQKLNQIDKVYDKYFSVLPSDSKGLFPHYVAIEFVGKNELPKPEFNSFFITDIEMARKSPNQTLTKYIEGIDNQQRIEIDENKEEIEKLLHPSNLPDGRWPSQTEHRLSLMQQVAVNQITSCNEQINSVNGPPGTGKTTLLKDIFAHFVVERGKELAQLSHPKQAFKPTKIHETDEKPLYLLKDSIARFKMVVASSNNGAVENISKDLPKIDEIIRNPNECAFPEYETDYAKLTEELRDFASIAHDLISESAWGLFSGVFGKSKNINEVLNHLLKNDQDNVGLAKLLQNENKKLSNEDIKNEWKAQKKAFLDELENVQNLKERSIEAYEVYKKYEKSLANEKHLKEEKQRLSDKLDEIETKLDKYKDDINQLNKQINDKNKQKDIIDEYLKVTRQNGFMSKLKSIFSSETDEQSQKYIEEKKEILDQKYKLEKDKQTKENDVVNKSKEKELLNNQLLKVYKQQKDYNESVQRYNEFCSQNSITMPSRDFWNDGEENYAKRQMSSLWTSDELQYRRAMLFLRAMILHKLLLIANSKTIFASLNNFKNRRKLIDAKPEVVYNAWNVMHLIFPIVSTTFASFKSMYQGIPKDFIDYLFIDEAGQAVPQSAVGALYRSKNVVAVGDPIQIEPVVTLESHLIDNIRKSYNIPERLLSKEASVQSVADYANQYGFWKDDPSEEQQKTWIGIPLWVHRRCLNPMFTIANQIAYNNKMVLPEYMKKPGKAGWHHVTGKSINKQYVKEHGNKVVELLVNDWKEAQSNNKNEPSSFVISPFSAVQQRVKALAKKELPKNLNIEKSKINDWVDKSIGTVHTFQGKEAQKVYFIVGTDNTQDGAVNWSCEKPNLLNVAVTRAKKEFYVIGDLNRIHLKPFYEIIYKELNVKNG
ncbi:ATPase [Staphylococcus pasteuri]|uniref:DEAD/DEAH box helicase n=1 Tax=Staphylococcus pasteuri TaxID=45972 RepID=UPI000D357C91|nr:DEAD/DEAH box helicase [Staphylococcus pasteuri]PTU87980.1 ATPase [Staphylococcus pasteuri]